MKFYQGLLKKCVSAALAAAACLALLPAGASVPAYADAKTPPSANDTAVLRVKGIEDTKGVTVKAYPIAKQTYSSYGLSDLVETEGAGITNLEKPAPGEVSSLAAGIRKGDKKYSSVASGAFALTKDTAAAANAAGMADYIHKGTKAGMYLILADGVKYLYNPMIVTVGYGDPEDAGTIGTNSDKTQQTAVVDASSSYDNGAWVKRQKKPEFDKSIVNQTAKGEVLTKVEDLEVNASKNGNYPSVTFRISAVVPKYSQQYANPAFTITDTADPGFNAPTELKVTGITGATADQMARPSAKAKDEKALTKGTDYTESFKDNGFTVALTKECLQQNRVQILHIEYTVKMNQNTTYNEKANINEAKLTYSHSVDSDTNGELKSKTRVYSFEINPDEDKELTKNEKVRKDGKITAGAALEGAEFALFKADKDWKASDNVLAKATSEKNGRIHFSGLAAGNYVLKETKAPASHLMSSTVFKITIDPKYDEEKMISYTLKISGNAKEDAALDNTYNVTTSADGRTATRNHAANPFTVKDSPINGIVATGGRGIGYISALAAGLVVAGVFILRKGRHGRKVSE